LAREHEAQDDGRLESRDDEDGRDRPHPGNREKPVDEALHDRGSSKPDTVRGRRARKKSPRVSIPARADRRLDEGSEGPARKTKEIATCGSWRFSKRRRIQRRG